MDTSYLFPRKRYEDRIEKRNQNMFSIGFAVQKNNERGGNGGEAQQGPGDPPGSEFEWNLKFTFGPQVALQLGDFFDLDIRLWTFGEVSTKDGMSGRDFNDGKITSEHSFTFNLFGLGFGRGMEHKLGYQGGHNPFTQSDFRWQDLGQQQRLTC